MEGENCAWKLEKVGKRARGAAEGEVREGDDDGGFRAL